MNFFLGLIGLAFLIIVNDDPQKKEQEASQNQGLRQKDAIKDTVGKLNKIENRLTPEGKKVLKDIMDICK